LTAPYDRLVAALADRYRLLREVGAGGMATVYLAEDPKHDRKVAVKVLRPELAAVIGAERFLTEIKTTANLQHPHILPLFDSGTVDGTVFYVMPFVEGESLRDRLDREKQLSVTDAVRITSEVASALDYAHRHGVIHRDIKPENILLHDGRALVADFGIALAVSRSDGGTRMTETGMSLGTPHYMSPEQAMGERDLDARTDTYALGCVLYEMLTGEPPFNGPTAQAIVARVMTDQPRSITSQRHSVPPNVEAAIRTALEKVPADRFASAAEFATALGSPGYVGTTAFTTVTAAPPRRAWAVPAAVGIGALLLGVVVGPMLRPAAPPSMGVVRMAMRLPAGQGIRPIATVRLAISPDGRRIAYLGGEGTTTGIWVRELSELEARYLPGTEGAYAPFFSPDGTQIGFLSGQNGALRTVPAAGGPIQTVLPDNVSPWGADWAEDGNIYFTDGDLYIARVASTGGAVTRLSQRDSTQVGGATEHDFVDVLPNQKGAVFQLWLGSPNVNEIGLLDFSTGEIRSLLPGSYAKYIDTGHLLVGTADGRIQLLPFDQEKLVATGAPAVILEGLQRENTGGTLQFAVSRTGTLVYQAGEIGGGERVVWVSRNGRTTPVDSAWKIAFSDGVALAPDESRLVVTAVASDGIHLFVKALPSGAPTRLTFAGTTNDRPDWSPDSRRISFISTRPEGRQAWAQVADGSNPAELLTSYRNGLDEMEWTPDGGWLVGRTQGSGRATRKLVVQQVGVDTTLRVLVEGDFDSHSPVVSPDGKWLAYTSDESGTAEVYVRPFPEVNRARYKISIDGGGEPAWARSGRELFYRTTRGDMLAVPVTIGATFTSGVPVVLFNDPTLATSAYHRQYDVARDGRFLMVQTAAAASQELNVVINWFDEIRQRYGGQE